MYRRSANIVYATIEAESAPTGRGAAPAANAPGGGDSGIFRSDDGGATWRKVNGTNPRPMYFSQIRIDPGNPDRVLLAGVRLTISLDGGRTQLSADPLVHDDKHAIWWDPANSDHVLIGTDGGVYYSRDMTRTWVWLPNLPVGLFPRQRTTHVPYNVRRAAGQLDWWPQRRPGWRHSTDAWQTSGRRRVRRHHRSAHSRIVIAAESQDGNMSRRTR